MDDLLATCIREVAMLDQLEAMLLQMKRTARTKAERTRIRVRLLRLRRLRDIWQQPNRSNA